MEKAENYADAINGLEKFVERFLVPAERALEFLRTVDAWQKEGEKKELAIKAIRDELAGLEKSAVEQRAILEAEKVSLEKQFTDARGEYDKRIEALEEERGGVLDKLKEQETRLEAKIKKLEESHKAKIAEYSEREQEALSKTKEVEKQFEAIRARVG